ncbi:unnamed protein product [Dovyalis caffra]|uniref:Uncharacterized protein n=1 Tax=Dovyalis caffra TaxID=77055 RepID=A0AAV1SRQ1_9ROSI|nr:unnamed protein product [Dovyalis caffra]
MVWEMIKTGRYVLADIGVLGDLVWWVWLLPFEEHENILLCSSILKIHDEAGNPKCGMCTYASLNEAANAYSIEPNKVIVIVTK